MRATRNLSVRNRLTPEGWVYLVVMMFIVLGAVMRNVNLLIVMAGMMFFTIMINWRMAVHWVRHISARRRRPNRLHANELNTIQWEIENSSTKLGLWNLVVTDEVRRLPADEQNMVDPVTSPKRRSMLDLLFGEFLIRIRKRKERKLTSEIEVCFLKVVAGNSELQSYRVYFGQRGKYSIGPASLSTNFPFGLLTTRFDYNDVEYFYVGPELGQLVPTWEKRVQSTAVGSDSVKRQRSLEEDEFYALRPWRSGDSKKNIHWRTTARLGQPFVKQYDQQNNRDFALVIDLFADDDGESRERCETALSFAATATLAIGNDVQGQVAMAVCGKSTEICSSRTSQGIISESIRSLAIAQPDSNPETLQVISEIVNRVSGGTPVYIVSSRPVPEFLNETSIQAMLDGTQESIGIPVRQLRSLKQHLYLIRWLDVNSPEFKQVFTPAVDPNANRRLAELTEKWTDPAEAKVADVQR